MAAPRILVIGASAGGVGPLMQLMGTLHQGMSCATVIVRHTSDEDEGGLPGLIRRNSGHPAQTASHGAPIEPGAVLIAPPDHHVLVHDGRIVLSSAPTENHCRPAIDPLFRSAAASYANAAAGVILSGVLDDGTAGMSALRRSGGLAIVQDPKQAAFPQMPLNAIERGGATHVRKVEKMAELIASWCAQPLTIRAEVPSDVLIENDVMLRNAAAHAPPTKVVSDLDIDDEVLVPAPDSLASSDTLKLLLDESRRDSSIESALLHALRLAEERVGMYERLGTKAGDKNARRSSARVEEARAHADVLRRLVDKVSRRGTRRDDPLATVD